MDQRAELHKAMTDLARGDREAFDAVYTILWPMVRQFTARALPQTAESEDVAQDVLLKIFEQASTFDPERGTAASWAMSIAAFECRTVRKRHQRRCETGSTGLEHLIDNALTPEDQTIHHDLVGAARETLGTLQPGDMEAILGRLEGRKPKNVAGATLRKRAQRAFERLRSAWRRRYGVE